MDVQMIKFFAFLFCFSICMNNVVYALDGDQKDESTTVDQDEKENDENVVLLSYPSGASMGKLMQIAARSSDEGDDSEEEEDDNADNAKVDEPEAQETACDKIMEKEFADTKIIQLADNIAVDMGIVTKVSLNR